MEGNKKSELAIGAGEALKRMTDAMNRPKIAKLIDAEETIRLEFSTKLKELQSVLNKVNKHQKECKRFWSENFNSDVPNFIASFKNKDYCLLISRPDEKPCSVETFLPYGIDFKKIEVVKTY